MEPKFLPGQIEGKIYSFWEDNGFFRATIDKDSKPFSIVLPPPNANADLHLGHAMYVYEDIMIRYHKMQGFSTFWVYGADHAGIETQFVFEKQLKKEGKSRFDYDRETLYKSIFEFVLKNKSNMENQLRRLGFALDWSKPNFPLDPETIKIVYTTFKKLFDSGLLYRAKRLINYCINCGTSFSDLEVEYAEQATKLWYLRYPLKGEKDGITVATTRPETMLGDVAVAINPKDKRYKKLIGKTLVLPIVGREIPVVADSDVDLKFGTGAVKITPAHDQADWQISQRHNLPLIQVIGFNGRIIPGVAAGYDNLTISQAREKVIADLELEKALEKTVDYTHRVGRCYKCHRIIEPLPKEQWFIHVKPLADKARKLVDQGQIKIHPTRFKKTLNAILDNFIDWNVSRQIVWGIRIPAWYCRKCGSWVVTDGRQPGSDDKCGCGANDFVQDEDTFDTWFSSAQWPFITLQRAGKEYFDYFYPTSVMETGYDILRAWVARMIMIGAFTTGKEPFNNVFLHGMVRDRKGQKMSKSKGNVINPLEMIDKYGCDALRGSLIFGVKEGGDVVLAEEKIIGMRNYANKIWNMGRFIHLNSHYGKDPASGANPTDKKLIQNDGEHLKHLKLLKQELKDIEKKYKAAMKGYRFSAAFDMIYEFSWHRLADNYIEVLKGELLNGNIKVLDGLREAYFSVLKMLHPFMPFVTEAVWQVFHGDNSSILTANKK